MWFWGIVLLTLVVLAAVVPLRARARDDRPWLIIERALVVAALTWAVGVTIYLALVPTYEGVESLQEFSTTAERTTAAHRTLLEVNGPGVLVPMLIPVVLTALPLLRFVSATRRRLEVISAMLLLVFVVVGALSIGLLYAPSAMAMLIAAALAKAGQRHANLRSTAG
jgi:hypothetical protein